VRCERPPRVLLAANHAEVEALRVDIEHVPELTVVDEALETLDGRMIEEQVTDHEDPATFLGKRAKGRRFGPREAKWFFHKDVPTRAQRGFREREVGGRGGSHDDRGNGWIVENDL
jgi:hypothetical protein